jgi:hypothetical protein
MNKIIFAVAFVGLVFMLAMGLIIPSVNPKYFSAIVWCVVVFVMFIGKYAKKIGSVKRGRIRSYTFLR